MGKNPRICPAKLGDHHTNKKGAASAAPFLFPVVYTVGANDTRIDTKSTP
jgi:hypothetical protein